MSVPLNKLQLWIKVLYDFKYVTREGQEITITKDEKLILRDKTNADWWHAQRATESEAFFVPANYVEEIPKNSCQDGSTQSKEKEKVELPSPKEEKRHHDSFRNIVRKLSSNMNSSSAKPTKPVKLTKKNSMNSFDAKPKESEASTFAKCFGKDMKNSDNRPQNRFQEELENALVNRSQRNVVFSSKLHDPPSPKPAVIDKPPDIKPPDKTVPLQKLEKLNHKLQEDNKSKAFESITKEFESRAQKFPKLKPVEVMDQSILRKPAPRKSKMKIDVPKPETEVKAEEPRGGEKSSRNLRLSEMDDEAILRDERKMWAIERLMTELLEARTPNGAKEEPVIFDFSSTVAPKSSTRKSPKVLDEYNEANILNDTENRKSYEKPCYSSVSFKSRRKHAANLTVQLGKKEGVLQLTPSLEKLASEIQFIPASTSAAKIKACSKSDTALNEFEPPKATPSAFRSLDKNGEKKMTKPKRIQIMFRRKLSLVGKSEEQTKQQLKRKTRSLDDLNFVEEETTNLNLAGKKGARGKKEMFKSTDSLKKSVTKPVPAKRKIFDVFDGKARSSEYVKEKWPIDLERSTAVGFKTLLRTSDSGSEEFLQNKMLPNVEEGPKHESNDNLFHYENLNSSDTSRNVSSEMILSSIESSGSNINANFETSDADNFVQLPEGWKQEIDLKTRQICYVNDYGDKWFSSNDAEGKIYFFEENSNKSSWALPAVKEKPVSRNDSVENFQGLDLKTIRKEDDNFDLANDFKLNNWPQLFHGNMCILKEGFLNRTKITEHGKKLKKCWGTSYAVLTELFLLFFRDEKIFSAMKMGHLSTAKPDISVDLNGTSIEPGEKFSSRKNVFLISTIFGLQVLIQSDNVAQSTEWYQEIQDAIKSLPSGRNHGKCI